jgi:hypothetical protein
MSSEFQALLIAIEISASHTMHGTCSNLRICSNITYWRYCITYQTYSCESVLLRGECSLGWKFPFAFKKRSSLEFWAVQCVCINCKAVSCVRDFCPSYVHAEMERIEHTFSHGKECMGAVWHNLFKLTSKRCTPK